jgi:hypothetical protein
VHKSGNPDEIRTYDEKFLAKLDRYAKAVGSSSDLISYLENIEADPVGSLSWPTRLERLRACARYLEFRKFYTLPDQPTKLAKVVRCCQSHLCAFCAITRAAKTLKYWHPRIMGQLLPGVVPDLVTLTRSSTESIGDAFASMSKALVKLWKSGRDGARPGRAGSSLSHAIGAGFSFEVKRGEGTRGGGWHVHTHGIVLSPGGVCADHLREDWCELLGGAADPRAQDVRPLRSFVLFTCDDLAEAQLAESMGHDLCEVFKYPMKFSSLTPADRVEAFRCLSGRRLFRAMGALKGCEPDPAYLDEELQLDDLPHLRMVLRYAEGRYVMERQEFC